MRTALTLLTVLCLCAVPILSQTPATAASAQTSAAQQADADGIRQIEADLLKGENTTDVGVFDRMLADDYVNLIPRGVGPGKAEILQHMRPHAGQAPPYSVETSDMRIYVLGESAVASYVKAYTARENGKTMREDITHIFTKDHGLWRLRFSRASACQND